MTQQRPDRPRVSAVLTAGVASAAGFFVITRSGLAGTLAGAAVASMVYTGAAHGLGLAVDRGAAWWIERRRTTEADGASVDEHAGREADRSTSVTGTDGPPSTTQAGGRPAATRSRHPVLRRRAASWGPVALAVLALGVSGYSVFTGTPLERVVIREVVVERPVVEERVVVEQSTVTVTVPVAVQAGGSADTTPTTTPPAGVTTSSTLPSTTTTTLAEGATTDTTDQVAVTTTTAPSPPTTVTAPGGP